MRDAGRRLPIALSAGNPYRREIRNMADAIRRDPMALRCKVSLDAMRTPSGVTVSHGDIRIGLPVFGTWPLDDLSPAGIAALMDDLHEDSGLRVGVPNAQSIGLEPLAAYAFALASARGDLDTDVPREPDGSVEIEVCLEEDGLYAFWVNLADGADTPYQLKVDCDVLARLVGDVPIPCHAWAASDEDGPIDCIGQSPSDSEGIMMQARPLDAMESLRMHRVLSEGRKA